MKNLKPVLLTFLVCLFTVNVCRAEGMENMIWMFRLLIFATCTGVIYIINFILIVWKKWIPWVIISSICILVLDIIFFKTDPFYAEYPLDPYALIYLIIFGFHATNIYKAYKIARDRRLKP